MPYDWMELMFSTFGQQNASRPYAERAMPPACRAAAAVLAMLGLYGVGTGAMGAVVGAFAGPHLLVGSAIQLAAGILAWMACARFHGPDPFAWPLSIAACVAQSFLSGACLVGVMRSDRDPAAILFCGLMFAVCLLGIVLLSTPASRAWLRTADSGR